MYIYSYINVDEELHMSTNTIAHAPVHVHTLAHTGLLMNIGKVPHGGPRETLSIKVIIPFLKSSCEMC